MPKPNVPEQPGLVPIRGDIQLNPTLDKITVRRLRVLVSGLVQGVGFRPFVYRLAAELHLAGYVTNDHSGVLIEIEGPGPAVETFCRELSAQTPRLAHIERCKIDSIPCTGDTGFQVADTRAGQNATAQVCPDIAVCEKCLQEMRDQENRRFGYPFINCTNCGPRFTIVNQIPYDRPGTSMAAFPMCPTCAAEYTNPGDRRFQAQPIACPSCGPRVWLHDGNGVIATTEPIVDAGRALAEGKIVALRGLGGFHLAVNADNEDAVTLLRSRKHRKQKPFALMAGNIETVRRCCHVSESEANLLTSPERPIVLLDRREAAPVANAVAPGSCTLGVMLPYTPLHHLLFETSPPVLVMTSGNRADEPIAIDNDEALERLKGVADLFLLHDREIVQRCDDSIVRVSAGGARFLRRARGFVPSPVTVPQSMAISILACGGEQKDTIALARHNSVVLSQHLGDLDNPLAYEQFEQTIDRLCAILQYRPHLIACDLHPAYRSTRWAHFQTDLPVIDIQHHHAHLCSVMAENGVTEPTIGVILDGTGYGPDHTVWGGEVLIGDYRQYERIAWLKPVPLLGGSAAITEPWRMALAYLWTHAPDHPLAATVIKRRRLTTSDTDLLRHMHRTQLNSPMTSSCGRLFDAIAAMLGLADVNRFEAQAAMILESEGGTLPLSEDTDLIELPPCNRGPLDSGGLIRNLLDDIHRGVDRRLIARRAHRLIAETFLLAVLAAREDTGIDRVGLSGGVFQNRLILDYLHTRLTRSGFRVLLHEKVPTNDGGLSLGQVVAANARYLETAGTGA
jgi:hydrogenase maturation protein HypF